MRTLSAIAREINSDWTSSSRKHAAPYISAMLVLRTLDDAYYHDDARSIVLYFLSNASTWRGPVARRVKKELNDMLKEHKG